ncbi:MULTISPECIES: hypothetical protein [unclassified Microbacterium]|uniref:hypothetical protein n=1 Tax=unclassified Microbacterium TaxID=2609290 RepID=UPI0038669BDA
MPHTGRNTSAGVVWSRVEDGFHVASRAGNFLGYIDRRRDGAFEAFDMRSRSIGRFAELVAAMRAVSTQSPPAATVPGVFTIRETR